MPAKKAITKQMIINSAYELVKNKGMSALNARSLSAALGCSTRPIYLSFSGMDEVKAEVVKLINQAFQTYLKNEVDRHIYPEYKAYGMAYIRFAKEQKHLFSYMFMRSRQGESKEDNSDYMTDVFKAVSSATGLEGSAAQTFHYECWIFVHGIATMLATSYLNLSDEAISGLITDMFTGLKARYQNNI